VVIIVDPMMALDALEADHNPIGLLISACDFRKGNRTALPWLGWCALNVPIFR
jgi:hypothetical protein